jgi:shikimate kinase
MSEIEWQNGVSGDFNVGTNWTGDSVPGASDDALITASGTYTVTDNLGNTVNSVTTSAGATLSITARTFTPTNGITNAGAIERP